MILDTGDLRKLIGDLNGLHSFTDCECNTEPTNDPELCPIQKAITVLTEMEDQAKTNKMAGHRFMTLRIR